MAGNSQWSTNSLNTTLLAIWGKYRAYCQRNAAKTTRSAVASESM